MKEKKRKRLEKEEKRKVGEKRKSEGERKAGEKRKPEEKRDRREKPEPALEQEKKKKQKKTKKQKEVKLKLQKEAKLEQQREIMPEQEGEVRQEQLREVRTEQQEEPAGHITDEQAALIFWALGDDVRLQIVNLLTDGELCAADLLKSVRVVQSTLSHHMKILCEAQIVRCRRQGKWSYYSIQEESVEQASAYLLERKRNKSGV